MERKITLRFYTTSQIRSGLKKDLRTFLDEYNAEQSTATRALDYTNVQIAAHLADLMGKMKEVRKAAISYVEQRYDRFPDLTNAEIAMQCVCSANDENSRRTAARKAKSIERLLEAGVKPENIAETLLVEGGVDGVNNGKSTKSKVSSKAASQADEHHHGDDLEEQDEGDGDSSEAETDDEVADSSASSGSKTANKPLTELEVPPASRGYVYVHLEVPVDELDHFLKEGDDQIWYRSKRVSRQWVLVRKIDDEEDE